MSNVKIIRFFTGKYALYALFFVMACFQGYRLGTGDLDTYLPFVYHEYDPSLFKSDMLMETVGAHPVYIWKAMSALVHLIPAQTLFLLAFFVQILIIMAGLVLFYREFFGNDKGALLLLSMMAIAKSSAAMGRYGLNPYGYFHPGAMAFGVLLLVFVLWNRKKFLTGGALGGLMFLFHPFTAVTMGLTFAAVLAFQWRSSHFKRAFSGGIVMTIVALPAFIPYFLHFLSKDSAAFDLQSWIEIVRWRMNHSFFISKWVSDRFVHLGIALAVILSFYRHKAFRAVIPVVIASVLSILMMAAGEIFSSKMLLQLQLARTSYLIFVIMFMFMANRAAKIDTSRFTVRDMLWFTAVLFVSVYSYVDEYKKSPVAVILAVLVFLLPVMTFLYVSFGKRLIKSPPKIALSRVFIVAAAIIFPLIATLSIVQIRFVKEGVLFDSTGSDYTDIALWVRDNIAKNEMVMSPIYLEGFRSFSLHPIYGTYKDGAPHNYCETTVFRWWKRMQEFGMTTSMERSSYPEIYHEKALDIARREGIKYVVFEKSMLRDVPVLFENKRYAVCKIGDR